MGLGCREGTAQAVVHGDGRQTGHRGCRRTAGHGGHSLYLVRADAAIAAPRGARRASGVFRRGAVFLRPAVAWRSHATAAVDAEATNAAEAAFCCLRRDDVDDAADAGRGGDRATGAGSSVSSRCVFHQTSPSSAVSGSAGA